MQTIKITNFFNWRRFSTFETLKFKLQTLYLWLLCWFFHFHSWEVCVDERQLPRILSLNHYKRFVLNEIRCEFCKSECFDLDDSFTAEELTIYNREAVARYERYINLRHNETINREKSRTS